MSKDPEVVIMPLTELRELFVKIELVRKVLAEVPENRKTLGVRALISKIEKALDGEQ